MEKLYNDKGQVAVAISNGYGAGWSTWNDIDPMDKRFNELFVANKYDEAEKLAKELGECALGIYNIEIKWINPGTSFSIEDNDGNESIKYRDGTDWYTC